MELSQTAGQVHKATTWFHFEIRPSAEYTTFN